MRAILAVDSKGGVGVGNKLAIIDKVDQAYFRGACLGLKCVAGHNTYDSVKDLLGVNVVKDNDSFVLGAQAVLGGVKTYEKYAFLTTEAVITIFNTFNEDCDKFIDVYKVYAHLGKRETVFKSKHFEVQYWREA